MIEVMSINDIESITSAPMRKYLFKRFEEIGTLNPPTEGYFLIVNDFALLQERQPLHYMCLPSIAEGLFDHIEGISVEGDIVEVSLLFNNEFLMSLVFNGLDEKSLEIVTKEKKK